MKIEPTNELIWTLQGSIALIYEKIRAEFKKAIKNGKMQNGSTRPRKISIQLNGLEFSWI